MASDAPLYLETSVALRATLEQGTTPEIENRIAAAPVLVTSRLSLVERRAPSSGSGSRVACRKAG